MLIPAMNDLIAQNAGYEASVGDATSAADMLGRALNGQYTSLKRQGIMFTEAQEQVLKPDGGTGSPKYGAAGYPDVNAGFMYQTAKVKGKISDMPEIPGLIVYSKSHPHVGIYIGNGYTIESTLGARGDGVVKRKLDSFWEYWFQCPYIEYTQSGKLPANDKSAKTVEEVAKEVISGKWGTGAERKKRLTDAGYDYYEVQAKVNEILRG